MTYFVFSFQNPFAPILQLGLGRGHAVSCGLPRLLEKKVTFPSRPLAKSASFEPHGTSSMPHDTWSEPGDLPLSALVSASPATWVANCTTHSPLWAVYAFKSVVTSALHHQCSQGFLIFFQHCMSLKCPQLFIRVPASAEGEGDSPVSQPPLGTAHSLFPDLLFKARLYWGGRWEAGKKGSDTWWAPTVCEPGTVFSHTVPPTVACFHAPDSKRLHITPISQKFEHKEILFRILQDIQENLSQRSGA